jgi:hypothetical protein
MYVYYKVTSDMFRPLSSHLQGEKNKNTFTIIMSREQSAVKKIKRIWLNSRISLYRVGRYRMWVGTECVKVQNVGRYRMWEGTECG